VLLRPAPAPQPTWGWVPLLAGVAACTAVRAVTPVAATLKWPNDVLVGEAKLGGILAERAGAAVVVGIGLNIAGGAGELPVPTATSLELHGAGATDRAELLAAILSELGRWYLRWRDAGGDAQASGLRAEYLRLCATVGREVLVELPGRALAGIAAGVDDSGRLLVASASGPTPVTAGDVIHVR
jgi:BirA family transcriptional regulator, biotin operon repressor / biotin---[acetyl-CoA-carboxylase] ligase